jgi:hypothetical protein
MHVPSIQIHQILHTPIQNKNKMKTYQVASYSFSKSYVSSINFLFFSNMMASHKKTIDILRLGDSMTPNSNIIKLVIDY